MKGEEGMAWDLTELLGLREPCMRDVRFGWEKTALGKGSCIDPAQNARSGASAGCER